MTDTMGSISNLVDQLSAAHRSLTRGNEQVLNSAAEIAESSRRQDSALRELITSSERLRKSATSASHSG
jgi:methyl-accepting chemotaxis protein